MTIPQDEIAANAGGTSPRIKYRLYVMMFLQYFIQGCYLPIISLYLQQALKFDSEQLGYFGAALAVGPLFAPFLIGQLVDRHLSTQYVLAFCHASGGIVMLLLFMQSDFWPALLLGTLYSILYVPSLMLTNSLTFYHLVDREREFPLVRLWGTIGFVVPAWLVEFWWLRGLEGDAVIHARGITLAFAGIAGLVMAVYCLSLPATPPPNRGSRDFAPGKVIGLLRRQDFLTLVFVSFGIAMVHNYFFVWNSPFLRTVLQQGGIAGAWEQRISSIGQIAEVVVMAGLGLMITRLGFKRTMLIGITAYFTRFVVFAIAGSPTVPFLVNITLACLGQALHGFCFACFLATAYMYVDRMAPVDVRGSMQNLYGTFVIGIGFFLGGILSGYIGKAFSKTDGQTIVYNWVGSWLAVAGITLLCLVAFALWFPRKPIIEDGNVVNK